MAVYTQCRAEDIADFLARYDVGELRMAKGIAEGVQNTNYLIETDRNRYFLTLYEKTVEESDLPYFHGLTTHLAARGLPVPAAIADRAGRVLQTLCGRPACLIQFLSGVSVSTPTPAHCRAVGQALAQLHLAAADYGMSRPNALGLAGWHSMAQQIGARANEIAPALHADIAAGLAAVALAWPRDLPFGTVHADLFPDNVLFTGTQISGLIDFYFACSDFLAFDLAILVNSWAFSADGADYMPELGAAVLDGYQSIRPLREDERRQFTTLCQGAALRFLTSRAYDWLHTPATALVNRKDPLAYLRRLRWFQQNDIWA